MPEWCRHIYSSRGSAKHRSQLTKLWIPGSTATFCGYCVKTCRDIAPNFGENRPGCFTMTTPRLTLSSSLSSFWWNTKLLSTPPPPTVLPWFGTLWLFLFPKMKLKLKGLRFDTTEEIQAKSQRVLDTLTETNFQETFQKWRRRWDRCLHAGGN
jgi:hypothetical protein